MRIVEDARRRVRNQLTSLGPGAILVAVSGGADSTCLLDVLASAAGDRIAAVCYIDHGLRAEASSEVDLVRHSAHRLGIRFLTRAVDTQSFVCQQKVSMETAARTLRYQALRELAREAGASYIALGHTANDQIETVLMHAFRGSGLTGLAGMQALNGDLFRPLLSVERTQTVAYCYAMGLAFVDDPTNQDTNIRRNHVRHELLPAIERRFPGAGTAMLRLSRSVREENDFLDRCATEWLSAVTRDGRIHPGLFPAVPSGLRSRLLYLFLKSSGGRLTRRTISDLTRTLEKTATDHLPQSASPMYFEIGQSEPVPLEVPGVTVVSGLRFDAILRSADTRSRVEVMVSSPASVHLDKSVAGGLAVRTRRPGDRIRRFGSTGSRKLHDLFIDVRIPRSDRDRVPVVAAGSDVIWIPGLAIAELTRVGECDQLVEIRCSHCRST